MYALATADPERPAADPELGQLFTTLYELNLERDDYLVLAGREVGELVGFGYGHRWQWKQQSDAWSTELAELLADEAPALDDSFAIQLLLVHPSFTGQGLGFEVLKRLMIGTGSQTHWVLLPAADSGLRRLFTRMGFRPLPAAPPAPDGSEGVILIHRLSS